MFDSFVLSDVLLTVLSITCISEERAHRGIPEVSKSAYDQQFNGHAVSVSKTGDILAHVLE
jgi:hypothetical protein